MSVSLVGLYRISIPRNESHQRPSGAALRPQVMPSQPGVCVTCRCRISFETEQRVFPKQGSSQKEDLFLAYYRFPKQNTRDELPDLQSPLQRRVLDTSNRSNGVTSAAGPRRPQNVLCQASLERPVSRFCVGMGILIAGSQTFPDLCHAHPARPLQRN